MTRGDWPKDRSQLREERLRRTNFIVVADGNGNIVEQWTQWDSILTLPHQAYVSPYDRERHVWVIDSGGGEGHMQVLKFSNDGKNLVMQLGERDHPKTREEARANPKPSHTPSVGPPSWYSCPTAASSSRTDTGTHASSSTMRRLSTYPSSELSGTVQASSIFLHGLAVDEDRILCRHSKNSRIQVSRTKGSSSRSGRASSTR